MTRNGQPLSYSRAPAADLAPWIGRLYVTVVDMPEGHRLDCGLFVDTSCLRIQLRGAWRAQTPDGALELGRAALFFGPQSRRMPISVTGSFTSVGVALRPGACRVLSGPVVAAQLDRIAPISAIGGLSEARWLNLFDPLAGPEAWCLAMEGELRALVSAVGGREPDPVSARFEIAAYTDPTASVRTIANMIGTDQRRLQRIVNRDFGMPPKQVLRRARALDMASHLRGVADEAEAEALALRYYDQSHLIREFAALFGMSPRQFVKTPQPLMTLGLETRQIRRLETIARIGPGELRPWQ